MIWREDDGCEDDAESVHAHFPEAAVEKWAERDDAESADYLIVGGQDATVMVRAPDGDLLRYRVTGEAVPSYSAYIQPSLDRHTEGKSE